MFFLFVYTAFWMISIDSMCK